MNYWMANPNWGREYSLEPAWNPHRYKTPDLGLLAFPACQSHMHISFWETGRSHYKSKRNHIFSSPLVLGVITRLSCPHLIHHFAFSPTLALPGPLISLPSCVFFFSTSPSDAISILFLSTHRPGLLSSSIAPAQLMISLSCVCTSLLCRYIIQSSATHRPS